MVVLQGFGFCRISKTYKKKDSSDSSNFQHVPWFPDHKANSKNWL